MCADRRVASWKRSRAVGDDDEQGRAVLGGEVKRGRRFESERLFEERERVDDPAGAPLITDVDDVRIEGEPPPRGRQHRVDRLPPRILEAEMDRRRARRVMPAEERAAPQLRRRLESDEVVSFGETERPRGDRGGEAQPREKALRHGEPRAAEDRDADPGVHLLREPPGISELVRQLVVGEPGDDPRVAAGERLSRQTPPDVEVVGGAPEVFDRQRRQPMDGALLKAGSLGAVVQKQNTPRDHFDRADAERI